MTLRAAPGEPLHGDALEEARRRSTRLLIATAALSSVAHIAAVTVAAIAARELLDDASLAGAPNTTSILGAALGTSMLAWLMVRRGHGHGLEAVGFVISAHTLGMFALSPLSGRITQRLGAVPSLLGGTAILGLAAMMAIAAPPDAGPLLVIGLFLLGYGWNLGFVAGSTLLVSGVEHAERTRTEGFSDTLIWGSSAVASLASGFVLASVGYAALGAMGLALVGVGMLAVLRLRRRLNPQPAAS